ncbi:MAG: 50S ribosomal protein L3 [Candidatus Aenigmatarchaeota archaeon]|nr:MAG: 50S ribosomal protein L3 [Candidatus Aenigmarchaeota archaeon]
MAKSHKPKKGSRAYWPKKRARRVYPRINTTPKADKAEPMAFAAYKAGMSRAKFIDNKKGSPTSGKEVVKSVTILDCPPLIVCGIKAYKKTPYGLEDKGVVWTDNINKDLYRKTNTPKKVDSKKRLAEMEKGIEGISDIRLLVHTKPRESGIRKKKPELFELPIGGEDVKQKWDYAKAKLGSELKVSDVFSDGDAIDVLAVTKGKGFQGVVKRFGVKIRPRKHEKKRRHVGNIGAVTPGRVLPGKIAMPGQLGFQTRTEYNKRILKIGEKGEEVNPVSGFTNYGIVRGGYMVIAGSVPGPKKRLIMLRKTVRPVKESPPVDFKKVLLDSQNQ